MDTLVLIHGLGNRSSVWQPQQELADTFNLVTQELQGNTILAMARNIIDMLTEPAHICGISMGVAQEIYRLTPELVESLILVNTFSYVPFFMRDYVLKQWKDTLASMDDETYIKSSARACLHSDDPDKLRMAEKSFCIDDRESFLRRATDAVYSDYLSLLPNVDVPTLVIGCRHDRVVPLYVPWYTHIWITGSRFVMLDAGHLCNIDAPREFNDVVRDFVSSVGMVRAS